MKRQIINIDQELCNGCGACIPGCPEGALQIIDGKARLISDLFCDGLGACIGTCPEGAIHVEEREAEPYDEKLVMHQNIIPQGENTIKAHLHHLKSHGETGFYKQALEALDEAGLNSKNYEIMEIAPACNCPSEQSKSLERKPQASTEAVESELSQWPVQLHLINPSAQYFDNADLLISADCVPYAYGDYHRRFLAGKKVITFCPKLDKDLERYIEKLAEIFKTHTIKSVTIVRMEVPCCGGTEIIVQRALELAGKMHFVKVNVISVDGKII